MTALRLISLPAAAAFELLTGVALMVLPIVLGASPAGAIPALAAGALVVGMAFGKAVESVPVGAQYEYDWGLALGLAVAAVALGALGQPLTMLAFAGAALVRLVLNLITRYSL